MIMSRNLYETIKALELAHQRKFDAIEIKNIIINYYNHGRSKSEKEAPSEHEKEGQRKAKL